ncbi:MAG: SMP-30/gluconolactonase/LRE family protein, partial [Actinomycetota bacterium]
VHRLDGGKSVDEITITGQNTDETHGLLAMAFDADGRLYVLDRNPPRLLRLDLSGGRPKQTTYATFPDLAPCTTSDPPCSPTSTDSAPFADYLVFDRKGNAYVTDLEQATIFIVPPGGGKAKVWFADPRLDSVFGPNGIAFGRDGNLYFAMTGSTQPTEPTQGLIYRIPPVEKPEPDDLEVFHKYPEPAAGPDGIAFGKSGKLYVALAGANQMSILNPDGTEELRFPSQVENQGQEIPYDLPASVAFDGRGSLLVTNQSFFTANEDHWAVFDVWVNDLALPLIRPQIP